jgi:endonuclease III
MFKWYEEEFREISKSISSKDSLSYLDFLRIRNFKLQNSSREKEKEIKNITREAFKLASKDEIEKAISKLLELHGVAIPIASTILAMRFPKKYVIIDRICISNLGKKEWLKDYLTNPKTYKSYLLLMREKSKENNLELREFERRLFENRN